MIEVIPAGNRWTWQLICAAGRVLVYTPESYETDHAAADAARAYRRSFWGAADLIDHRQGRAV